MAHLIIRPSWHLSEKEVTPETLYGSRRAFLRTLGMAGTGLALAGLEVPRTAAADSLARPTPLYPARVNKDFPLPADRTLTDEKLVTTYNNFYEFSTVKDRVHRLVDAFTIDPWRIEVTGLCEKPFAGDVRELIEAFPIEERIYRFRCVEAWSMVVPWTGFPLSLLLDKVQPRSGARFVRFTTANRPAEMPGIGRLADYPWPYTEGLRMDEARHPLTLLACGLYGKPMPKQNGAPIRLVVPWKYGYKSIKSIDRIELTDSQPKTLWESLAPHEYPFESNVDPGVPHPRWSQASERVLGSNGRIPTLKYNGYGDAVAHLYAG